MLKLRMNLSWNSEHGCYQAEVRSLPHAAALGKTHEEALANLRHLVDGHIARLREAGRTEPGWPDAQTEFAIVQEPYHGRVFWTEEKLAALVDQGILPPGHRYGRDDGFIVDRDHPVQDELVEEDAYAEVAGLVRFNVEQHRRILNTGILYGRFELLNGIVRELEEGISLEYIARCVVAVEEGGEEALSLYQREALDRMRAGGDNPDTPPAPVTPEEFAREEKVQYLLAKLSAEIPMPGWEKVHQALVRHRSQSETRRQ
jgi:predicted RNase H-like HicB family nuclease